MTTIISTKNWYIWQRWLQQTIIETNTKKTQYIWWLFDRCFRSSSANLREASRLDTNQLDANRLDAKRLRCMANNYQWKQCIMKQLAVSNRCVNMKTSEDSDQNTKYHKLISWTLYYTLVPCTLYHTLLVSCTLYHTHFMDPISHNCIMHPISHTPRIMHPILHSFHGPYITHSYHAPYITHSSYQWPYITHSYHAPYITLISWTLYHTPRIMHPISHTPRIMHPISHSFHGPYITRLVSWTLYYTLVSSLPSAATLQWYGPIIFAMERANFAPLQSRNYLTNQYRILNDW